MRITKNVAGTQTGNSCEQWLHRSKKKKFPRRRVTPWVWRMPEDGGCFRIKLGKVENTEETSQTGEESNELYHQCCTFMRNKMVLDFYIQKGKIPVPKKSLCFQRVLTLWTQSSRILVFAKICTERKIFKCISFVWFWKGMPHLVFFQCNNPCLPISLLKCSLFLLHTCYYNRDMSST